MIQADSGTVSNSAVKRKLSSTSPPAKRSKTLPKNAVCALHQMYRGLDFKVEQEGPVHMPLFTVAVEVNGSVYQGVGKNKKLAKHAAAEAALRSLVQVENPSQSSIPLGLSSYTDFTTDVSDVVMGNFDVSKDIVTSSTPHTNGSGAAVVGNQAVKTKTKFAIEKGPVMLLNELHPKAKFEVVSENGEQYNKFTMAVVVDDRRFEGTGPSKKLSKAAASRSALASLHDISFSHVPTPNSNHIQVSSQRESTDVPQVFADHVANLVNQKFASLMENDVHHARRKVLAGIVMSKGFDIPSCQLISVSTGTKCIKGEHMSVSGGVVQDCHAEIISRRCLIRFLYDELKKLKNETTADDSIFEKWRSETGYRLKPIYKFHLFISTAPCGDSRIFSPHDEELEDKHPNRKARGKLRTKIESGEGTIPVKSNEAIQTWDGVLQGERLLTMSCSDKVAKWNVLGLQGALLSSIIQPIYLESIILGSLFHQEHLYRAVCGRMENAIVGLPPPYRLNAPKLALISSKEVRHTVKAPNFSVNWTIGDDCPEIINAVSGKTEDQKVSRVAKRVFFSHYLQLIANNPTVNNVPKGVPLVYGEVKEHCSSYQEVKKLLYGAFAKAELGTWVKKPSEAEQFELSDISTST